MTRGGLSKHFQSCMERKKKLSVANESHKKEIIYHLLAQDNWDTDYWMHLEMPGNAILKDLDDYLRAIWLECCGHMSQFSIGRRGEEISMDTHISQTFEKDLELLHIYDFGTSSETKITCVSTRNGKKATPHPVFLMARNNPPEVYCSECEKPATMLCLDCLYNGEEWALCDEHAKAHSHDEYGGPIPIVNSPRLGMCGYTGPATPPY